MVAVPWIRSTLIGLLAFLPSLAGMGAQHAAASPGEVAPQVFSELRISEISYDPTGGPEYEFVELKNTGQDTLNLAGVSLADGIDYTFPAPFALAPGDHAVLVADTNAFASRYPHVTPAGQYQRNLANGGERLLLQDPGGNPLVDMTYDDQYPWPTAASGLGYSLVLISPDLDPSQAASWRSSTFPGGSPGTDDPPPWDGGVVLNELLANSDPPLEDAVELLNPTGSAIDVGGWFLSDRATDLRLYRLPAGTVIAPNGYHVLYEYQFSGGPGSLTPFALSSQGEELYLTSANSQGQFTGYSTAVRFGASDSGTSLGRVLTAQGPDLAALARRSFGVDDPTSVQQFRTGQGAPNAQPQIGPVVINELMYNPPPGEHEYLELYNRSGLPVPLFDPANPTRTWKITDGISYTLPANTTLPAAGFLLLVDTDPILFRTIYDVPDTVLVLGPYSGALANEGERVELARPGQGFPDTDSYIAADFVDYNDEAPWPTLPDGAGPSLERRLTTNYGNDPVNWAPSNGPGSPGRVNSVVPPSVPVSYLPIVMAP